MRCLQLAMAADSRTDRSASRARSAFSIWPMTARIASSACLLAPLASRPLASSRVAGSAISAISLPATSSCQARSSAAIWSRRACWAGLSDVSERTPATEAWETRLAGPVRAEEPGVRADEIAAKTVFLGDHVRHHLVEAFEHLVGVLGPADRGANERDLVVVEEADAAHQGRQDDERNGELPDDRQVCEHRCASLMAVGAQSKPHRLTEHECLVRVWGRLASAERGAEPAC